jgi:hypothetical protein
MMYQSPKDVGPRGKIFGPFVTPGIHLLQFNSKDILCNQVKKLNKHQSNISYINTMPNLAAQMRGPLR